MPVEEDSIRDVQIPALLVAGSKTRKVLRLFTDHLQKLMPNSKKVVITNATHLMIADNPDEFNKAAISFLNDN